MKAFVTGGAGFIGSNLVDELVRRKYVVTVYDNLSSGEKAFISHHLEKNTIKFVKADLLDKNSLQKAIAGHDIVFHLAANPDVLRGLEQTDLDLQQNAVATYNVLESMRRSNIKKIVFSSSGTVYGDLGEQVAKEGGTSKLTISLYGASKVYGENLISAFSHIFGLKAWIYRFANIIGDRQNHGVIYDFINKIRKNPKELLILGDGKQTKHYLYVKDCIEGILYGLDQANEDVNVYNLASKGTIDVNAIAKLIIQEMGLQEVYLKYTGSSQGWKGDVPVSYISAEKMKALGWEPKLTTKEAVEKTIKVLLS